jgi:hypothetical protein
MRTNHQSIQAIAPDFTYVDVGRRFPQARLVEPTTSGDLLLAAEVDRRPMFLPARFDLPVPVETTSPATAAELEAEPLWGELVATIEAASRRSYHLHGHNVRRMGPVPYRLVPDHEERG